MNVKKFGAGLIANVIIKFLSIGLGFYTTRWIVDNLTSLQYEQYNLVLAYSAIILAFTSFGIPVFIQKFYTNPHKKEEIANFWTTYSALRLISYLVGIIIILLTYSLSQTNNLVLILGIFTIQFILTVDINYRSIADAKGYPWKFALTDFGGKLILVLLLFLYPTIGDDFDPLWYFVFAAGTSYILGLLADSYIHRKLTPIGKVDFTLLKKNYQSIFYISFAFLVLGVYSTTDKLFLKYFGYSDTTINGYSNAYKLFEIAVVVPGLTAPSISSLAKQRLDNGLVTPVGKRIQKFVHQLTNSKKFGQNKIIVTEWLIFSIFIGFVSTIGIWLLGSPVLKIIDPTNKYPLSFSILPILALALIPISALFFFGNLVVFKDGEKLTFYGQIVVMIAALGLYSILIPMYGAYGAAWATVITYTIDFLTKVYQMRKVFDKKPSGE